MKQLVWEHLPEYERLQETELPDIHARGVLLRHKKSGARLVLIPCEDENKVFNIAFRTPPKDSTGVAHIIEHTVLCGSESFPLKDPFVELVKGSLNTFLNAITYPDKTMYPVASTNDADFRNLMHVYLDAVFFPNIYHEEKIFRQEGWHYELKSEDAPCELNGVVYNEMKGAFSSPEEILEREIMNSLFPDTPYGVESGGDPEVIPSLTYENYLDFHRKYYHPSNSYIYLYGDLDLEETLSFIDRNYLSQFDTITVDSGIPVQEPFAGFRRAVRNYPVSGEEEGEDLAYLSANLVAGDPFDIREMIAFDVLDYALLSQPGAPVRQALLDAGIGKDVYGSYSDGIRQPYFSVVAKYAKEADADRFLSIILDTLKDQAEKGIDPNALLAGLNYLEFQFREADYGAYPKGLMYSIDVLDSWLYDETRPFDSLRQLDAFSELRSLIGSGYFEQLIREKILGNRHGSCVVLRPEEGLQEKREEAYRQKMADFKASLTPDEIRDLVRKTEELSAWQDEEEDPELIRKLPFLKREDIRKDAVQIRNEETLETVHFGEETRPVRVLWHDAETNGIGYLECLWDLKCVPQEDLVYAAFLKSVLANVDTDQHTYAALNNTVNMETGGISCGVSVYESAKEPGSFRAYFGIRCKAFSGKMQRAMELIREIVSGSSFADGKRIREILSASRAQLAAYMQQAGHQFAGGRARAYESVPACVNDHLGGISFYRALHELELHYNEKEAEIREGLERVREAIFRNGGLLVSYTCEKDGRDALRSHLPLLLIRDGGAEEDVLSEVRPLGIRREGFTTAGQVQYAALAGTYKRDGGVYSGAMQILRTALSYGYLWQQIRVHGGAYGCGASFARNGSVVFSSSRDPKLRETLEVFRGIPDYIRTFDADEEELTRYVIGTISGMDTPLTPSLLGSFSLRMALTGVDQEWLQRSRDEVLGARISDIRGLADAVAAAIRTDAVCVVGSEGKIRECADLFDSIESLT